MKARVLVLAVVAGALASGGAHAGVTTGTAMFQSASMDFDSYDPMTNTAVYGSLGIYTSVGASTVGSSATPSTDAKASAFRYVCDFNTNICTPTFFDQQTVTQTALSMDPLGNAVSINACLLPSGGGACQSFDLDLSRPSNLSYGTCLGCAPNVWWDPSGAASVSSFTAAGIARYQYQVVTGTFAGTPFMLNPSNSYLNTYAGTTVSDSAVATLP